MASIISASTTAGTALNMSADTTGVLQLATGATPTTALTIDTSQNTTLAGRLTTASSGIQFSDGSTQTAAASPFGLKNRIINGDMVIDQRNNGASVTGNDNIFVVDRWKIRASQTSKMTAQQNAGSVTPSVGFRNYLGITSSSAYSVVASDYFWLAQLIEGFNTVDLAWGTANAQTVTLGFWVRSSLTGTFGGCLRDGNGGTAQYPFNYTISSANTWEYKTITVAGPTIGTWQTGNLASIEIVFSLGMGSTYTGTANAWTASAVFAPTGSTSVVGTNGATFYITGVQLERNTTATPFEWLPYTTELQLCQRYCPMIGPVVSDSFTAVGYTLSTTQGRVVFQFPVTARTAPTGITVTNPTGFALAPPFVRVASAVAFSESNTQYASVDVTTTGLTANQPTALRIGSSGGCKIEFTGCEL